MCNVPFTRNIKRIATFQVSGTKLFNALPKEIRNFRTGGIEDFKELFDAFLTTIPDEPRCPGLTPRATDLLESKPSNSLLHQIPQVADMAEEDHLHDACRYVVWDSSDSCVICASTTLVNK